MRAGAAKIKSLKRGSILRPADQRPEGKELLECLFAVMNVAATEPVLHFEIQRRDNFLSNDQVADAGRVSLEFIDYDARKLIAPRGPIAFFQLVRCKLHVDRHHMLSRRTSERRKVDIQIWLRGKLAILRRVKSTFEIIDLRPDVNAA